MKDILPTLTPLVPVMPQYRLLVIEDNEDIVAVIRHVAEEASFEVRTICNSLGVPSLYDEFAPHVVVMDVLMPNVDGFEVLTFLHTRHSSARIIIISGQADYRLMAARMAEGLKLTIIATIAKPFRIVELRQTLEAIKLLLPTSKHSLELEREQYA